MKKYILSLITVLILGACSSDDNGSKAINENNLVGKWYLKGGTTNGGSFQNYNHECSTSKDYQEFFANGNLNFTGYGNDCEINDTDSSVWELNGTVLTVSSPEFDPVVYSYDYIVKSISSQELILEETVNTPDGVQVNKIYMTRP